MKRVGGGVEFSYDEIVAMGEQTKREQAAKPTREAVKAHASDGVTIGAFSYFAATGEVQGPAEYLQSEAFAVVQDRINAGKSLVANEAAAHGSPPYVAALIAIQTDYAAWKGMREMEARLA